MALTEKITAIADAIRKKTNTTDKMTLTEMPGKIESITGGVEDKTEYEIRFYDYDGTLLHRYLREDFSNMIALPVPPNSVEGCTCTGWNYDINTIKSMSGSVNVAAIYVQDDDPDFVYEKPDPEYVGTTKFYFHFNRATHIDLFYSQTVANGLTVDWGDGSPTESKDTVTSIITLGHDYPKGDYVLLFNISDGCTVQIGSGSSTNPLIGSNAVSRNSLVKAEIDLRKIKLSAYCFYSCYSLSEVVFGDGQVQALSDNMFNSCYALKTVKLPHSINAIGASTFRYCYAMRTIEIPASVAKIGNDAFESCYRLHDITIPGSVQTIGSETFQRCYSLKNVTLENGITTINQNAFASCQSIQNIKLPNSITYIGYRTFYQCYALKGIVLPARLYSYGANMFEECTALKYAIFAKSNFFHNLFFTKSGIKFFGYSGSKIPQEAFSNCYSLKNISIGMNIKTIGTKAFSGCVSLEKIIIPSGITEIGSEAFSDCKSLKEISVPESLNTVGAITRCDIRSKEMQDFVDKAFESDALSPYAPYAFDGIPYFDKLEIPSKFTEIGAYCFRNNYPLETAKIPDTVTKINTYAFSNDYCLEGVEIPPNSRIEAYAFSRCNGIEEINIGDGTTIVTGGFSSCNGISTVNVKGSEVSLGSTAFGNCKALKEFNVDENVQKLTLNALTFSGSGLESIKNLPPNTILGTNGFTSCYSLQEADLSNCIASTDSGTGFSNCFALDDIKLQESTTQISDSYFNDCYSLTEIEIPEGVTRLGNNAFSYCRSLKKVTFKGNKLTTIANQAFYSCSSLTELKIPYSVKNILQFVSSTACLRDIYMYPINPPTGVASIGSSMASDYIVHVPKGSLKAYEEQLTAHAGHFEEFEYIEATDLTIVVQILPSTESFSLDISKLIVRSEFAEDQTFTVTTSYAGTNLSKITNMSFDWKTNTLKFGFERSTQMVYEVPEQLPFTLTADGMGVSCNINIQIIYYEYDAFFYATLENVGGYKFLMNADGYFESQCQGINNSYAVCKLTFKTNSLKLYLDCISYGENNYDYGIISNLDKTLSLSASDDAANAKKSFKTLSSPSVQTVEFDVPDTSEHFIYMKYRKDSSNSYYNDSLQFKVRSDFGEADVKIV